MYLKNGSVTFDTDPEPGQRYGTGSATQLTSVGVAGQGALGYQYGILNVEHCATASLTGTADLGYDGRGDACRLLYCCWWNCAHVIMSCTKKFYV